MNIYLFAYGSLMNPQSLAKTLPGERSVHSAQLIGFRRKTNAPFGQNAYLNIIPQTGSSVSGVLIKLSEEEFEYFEKREVGYAKTDVTAALRDPIDGKAYAFIAPDIECALKVPRSYIMTCTRGMSESEREQWIKDTIINDIEEDLDKPVYEYAA